MTLPTAGIEARLLVQQPTCATTPEGLPRLFVEAAGPWMVDDRGERWLDLDNAKGSVVLGHAHPDVAEAVESAARGRRGSGSGWSRALDRVVELLHAGCGGDVVALFSTGTAAVRAVATAVREARRRPLLLSAGYHGHDPMWRPPGAELEPNADGVVDFLYDLDVLETWLRRERDVAAVVVAPDYLHLEPAWYEAFSSLVARAGAPLVLDEVKVGYRYRPGLSAPLPADAWVVSKGVANGYRLAAAGGRAELLGALRDAAFTSFFEPTSLAAAEATLELLATGEPQEAIDRAGRRFLAGARRAVVEAELPVEIVGDGPLFQLVASDAEVEAALYAAAASERLLFFERDNQSPSAAFDDAVVDEASARFARACCSLAGRFPGREVGDEARDAAAWMVMDGLRNARRTPAATRTAAAGLRRLDAPAVRVPEASRCTSSS